MGFWHTWKFSKTYSPEEWDRLGAQAEQLFSALPKEAKRRAMADIRSGGLGIAAGAIALLGKRKTPARAMFGGSILGTNANGDACIGFLPCLSGSANAQEVEVPNCALECSAKTGAELYDHLLVGVLCLAEELRPGNVKVKSTDAEDGYWDFCAEWAGRELGRTLPMPKAIPGSARRLAKIESEQIALSAAPASKPSRPRRI